jgi:hypothetical protein
MKFFSGFGYFVEGVLFMGFMSIELEERGVDVPDLVHEN